MLQITNQKPAVLSPNHQMSATGTFDPVSELKKNLVETLFTPAIAGSPVTISVDGNQLDADMITEHLMECLGDSVNAFEETFMKNLYSKTLVYFDKDAPMGIQNLFAIQAAVKEQMDYPSAKIVYTPTLDIIPACKEFLAGICSYEKFFATFAFYARPQTLGVYFANNVAYDNFKTWAKVQHTNLAPILPTTTNDAFATFFTLSLDKLTESLLLRANDNDGNDEHSFPRTLMAMLNAYIATVSPAECGLMPFDIGELYCPKSIIFVNVEKHSVASAKAIADEWKLIKDSLATKPRVHSINKIRKLTAATRQMQKLMGHAANAKSNAYQTLAKQKLVRFRSAPPTAIDMTKYIKKIIEKMAWVARSENIFKSTKTSFAKANRRNPDDFNRPGRMVSTKYKPDIHLYLDTSGSVSEENYQDGVKACIRMAKALNINLWVNSFSHEMTQATKLHTKDKSTKAIYLEFQKLPKVTGGTDYEQIWHYINNSRRRSRELSIIMTDFEWSPPNRYVKHPKNLYYIPFSNVNWDRLVRYAKDFVTKMRNIDPNCRSHLLL